MGGWLAGCCLVVGMVGRPGTGEAGGALGAPSSAGPEPALVARLTRHVQALSRDIGDRNLARAPQLEAAARYIAGALEAAGYAVQAQRYPVGGAKVRNLLAVRAGASRPEERLVVGAHYDTCFNPGADDNASGVAALLELARALAAAPLDRTVVFAAFVNEEPPYFQSELMGSRVFVREALAHQERIVGAVILEMLGYYSDRPGSQQYPLLLGLFRSNRGDFLGVVGNLSSRGLVGRVAGSLRHRGRLPVEAASLVAWVPGVDWSDQWAFWRAGIPAVMVTDTAFLRNPHYHSLSDTWETLDYRRLAMAVEGLVGTVQDLASAR